jgi:hypothetical protein
MLSRRSGLQQRAVVSACVAARASKLTVTVVSLRLANVQVVRQVASVVVEDRGRALQERDLRRVRRVESKGARWMLTCRLKSDRILMSAGLRPGISRPFLMRRMSRIGSISAPTFSSRPRMKAAMA